MPLTLIQGGLSNPHPSGSEYAKEWGLGFNIGISGGKLPGWQSGPYYDGHATGKREYDVLKVMCDAEMRAGS